MINHARTLLLNRASRGESDIRETGGEYIPGEFAPLTLPAAMRRVHRELFGSYPDWFYANYRVQQCLAMLHATELVDYVLELDPRITYDVRRSDFFSPSLYLWRTSNEQIRLSGELQSADTRGNSIRRWRITLSGGEALITRYAPTFMTAEESYWTEVINFSSFLAPSFTSTGAFSVNFLSGQAIESPTSLMCGPVVLPGETATVEFPIVIDATYTIEAYVKPQKSLGEVAASLESVAIREIFGLADQEPFKTFLNLWLEHPELAYRLGGLLLAFIYSAEQLRHG